MRLSDVLTSRPDILTDRKKISGLLSDFYNADQAKVNRMIVAFDCGVFDLALNNKNTEFDRKALVDKLVTQKNMDQAKAIDAVTSWYSILSAEVLTEYRFYKERAEKQKKIEKDKAEKEKKLKEREEIQQEKEGKDSNFTFDFNDYRRYMNLDLSKGEIVRGIPCGVGDDDFGFIVRGTGMENVNEHRLYPSLHALVYNFLIRDSHIRRENYPEYMRTHFFNHELSYGRVYRYMMILLDLLKPEGKTVLRLHNIGDEDELEAAQDILNEYLSVFSRLIKAEPCSIEIQEDADGESISADGKATYYVENFKSDQGLRRRIRYGARINYNLGEKDKKDLEFLLHEISPFETFKKGQFNALCSMLNANGHAVCIMPTGSGKSLIYYFSALLQPQVVFVVSPTDILIHDQVRNLKDFHHFDNVTHLDLTSENDFSFFTPGTNLIFLTPITFQNRNLFGIFKKMKNQIAYVVLDEIHCLSSWGHDFRPEYLMLSKNMSRYLGEARYLGFTATANYTVVQDIQKQLDIVQENFFSPIAFEKYNVRYDFRKVDSTENMYLEVKRIADEIVGHGERALVFTKGDDISKKVADAIGYEADVFTADEPDGYKLFAKGLCRILVTNENLGIGINLPNVNCTVHFGMPVSKNEYVQEIGRAGRSDDRATSYVIYLDPTEKNIPPELLKRETVVDNLQQLLQNMNNDYADVYRKMNCGVDTSEVLYERLIDIYSDFHNSKKTAYIVDHAKADIDLYKQYLYMLYVIGYIKDWYTYRSLKNNSEIEMIIDVCSVPYTGHHVVALDDNSMLERMKRTSRDYIASMDNDRESIFKIGKAESIENVIRIYAEWFYDKFLYHHKEEFLDFFEFIINNKDCDAVKITEDIEDYFTLPFIQIKEDENYYTSLSFKEISDLLINGIGKNTLSNMERINTNRYSYKIDYLLFAGNWRRTGRFDVTRVERFWNKLDADEKEQFKKTVFMLYQECSLEGKWNFLRYLDSSNNITDLTLHKVVDEIYKNGIRDQIFYGIMAIEANKRFARFMRG